MSLRILLQRFDRPAVRRWLRIVALVALVVGGLAAEFTRASAVEYRPGRETLGLPDKQSPAHTRSPGHGNEFDARYQTPSQEYTPEEIVSAGHHFFGSISGNLAGVIEKAASDNKLPNGYILGEEAAGAFIGGVRYGEGTLFTRNAGQHKVYWQGPSVGFDFGGDGSRVMMLVYDLPDIDTIYRRYIGINGSAYAVGGLSVQAMGYGDTLVMPVRTGVGARLGVNMGYVKFTPNATWNPF